MYLVDWNGICFLNVLIKHLWESRPLTLLLQGEALTHFMSLVSFSYPRFSNVFRGYRKRPVHENGNWMLFPAILTSTVLTLSAPTPQNSTNCLSVFDHFVRLVLKGLKSIPSIG